MHEDYCELCGEVLDADGYCEICESELPDNRDDQEYDDADYWRQN